MDYRLEIAKIMASFATPIILAVFGMVVLRRLEGIKAAVARQSGFEQKWADRFFDNCQEFVGTAGRLMAVLLQLQPLAKEEKVKRPVFENEAQRLMMAITELEYRIKLGVVFAPRVAEEVVNHTTKAHSKLGKLLTEGGNLDEVVAIINAFHSAARNAHSEMLALGNVSKVARGRST